MVESVQMQAEAKRKVMEEYNIFPMLIKQFEAQNSKGTSKKNIVMKHENSYLDFYKIWMILKRLYIKKFK